MNYREAKAKSVEVDSSLLATDERFNNAVVVEHRDGLLYQKNAFFEREGEFLFVYAEHASPSVFPLEDVNTFGQFRITDVLSLEDMVEDGDGEKNHEEGTYRNG